MLDKNAKNRYKIEDIFNSDFIKKYEKKKLYFTNEKYINNTNENKLNLKDIKKSNNTLLLSSLIENDNLLNKTLFNNIKYSSPKKYNMKNKINNVIFNNVINRNPNNQNILNENANNELSSSREINRNINIIKSNNKSLNSSKDNDSDLFNSQQNIKTVKVTKLNTNYVPNDSIEPNISNVKKINNNLDLTRNNCLFNSASLKNTNTKFERHLINVKHQSIKTKENKINELNPLNFENNIKKKINQDNKSNSMKSILQTTRKENINNNIFQNENDKTFNNDFTNIKKKYYIKPKIEKDFHLLKDNTKEKEKPKINSIHFKNCINTKIKIPRRKILNSLHLENINIINNIDLLNNNDDASLNITNNLNDEYFQINDIPSEFATNNFQNNTYRINQTNRYDSSSHDNTIKTQINKNYIFNPNISINLPKYSFSNQKCKQRNNKKIKEIKEDIKDKIETYDDLSKSQIIQKNKFINNIKRKEI